MTSRPFTWAPFYRELADKLRAWEGRQPDLVAFLDGLRARGLVVTPLEDRDATGRRTVLAEIDPFTFFGVFNRGTKERNRLAILAEVKKTFGIEAAVPTDFDGIPILPNQNSWFIPFAERRKPDDVATLWRVFHLALERDPLADTDFGKDFDRALDILGVNVNLTMGLFWIRPDTFVALDKLMREHLGVKLPPEGLSFEWYRGVVRNLAPEHGGRFIELSHRAYLASQGEAPEAERVPERLPSVVREPPATQLDTEIDYWLVGAYWDGESPPDQTPRFLRDGIWENGYTDKFTDLVREMKVGDRVAIKAATVRRDGLPFDNRAKPVSTMLIKAVGTITRNPGNGRAVEVEWEPEPGEPRPWFFYTGRSTVWRLKKGDEYAQRLIRFVFHGEPQDYGYFVREWWDKGAPPELEATSVPVPYSAEDAAAEGVFLPKAEIEAALGLLLSKKGLILQGAPGVGKTFVARKLAYALVEARDDERVSMIQFHPSFSYEDFVRGYRPRDEAGRFELVDGPLLLCCERARAAPDERHVLVIDEINRGNVSQVFGELLMLIEGDKRGAANAVTPLYRRHADEKLWIPENLYFVGTMNRADRSLALVDYALRRRFAFLTLRPRFSEPVFREWLTLRGMPAPIAQLVIARMNELNERISKDRHLGRDFEVGHSFFVPRGDDFSGLGVEWYRSVVDTEIAPLIEEYWHDAPDELESALSGLRTGIP